MADTNTMDSSIEDTLEKTELGHVINTNKNIVKWGGVAIVLIVAAIAIVKNQQEKKSMAELEAIHKFHTTTVKQLTDGKIEAQAAVDSYNQVKSAFAGNPNAATILITMAETFREKGNFKEAVEILKDAPSLFNKGGHLYQLMSHNLAVAYEDNQEYDQAIGVLEPLLTVKNKLYEARVQFDLGRLYKMKGNNDKAKTYLKAVVDNFPNDELAKMAKLYLGQL